MNRRRKVRAACTLALIVACARPAAAQTRDPAAAEALFDDARRLMREHRYADACAKLEASERLDPAVGTILNLGDCLERAGRTASAWARFREAASAASLAGQTGREREARSRAEALERRLPRIVVRVAPAATPGGGEITVERDGIVVDPSSYGTALPIDPGAHVVIARAPHHQTWSQRIELGVADEGLVRTVEIPALTPDARAPAATPPSSAPSPADPPPPPTWPAQRTYGLVLGGAGVVALGVAGVLALRAKAVDEDARAGCDALGCSSAARQDAANAGFLADGATVSLIAAGALATAAVIVFFTAPSSSPKRAAGARTVPGVLLF